MEKGVTSGQSAAAAFAGILAPGAALAGGDWRGALLALPVVLGAAWCWGRMDDHKRWLGPLPTLIYIVWFLALSAAVLGGAGIRVTLPDRHEAGWGAVLASLPVVWLAVGRPAVFGRVTALFRPAMTVALLFVLVLGAGQVEWRWLLRPEGELLSSFVTAAGMGCIGVAAALLGGGQSCNLVKWSGGWSAAVALMWGVTSGVLGPAVRAAEEGPFFLMAVGLGRTARVEGLVSAVWLVADVTLAALLLQSGRKLWREARLPWERWSGWILSLGAVGGALWVQKGDSARWLLAGPLSWAGLILGGVFPVLACAAGGRKKVKKKRKRS